MLQKVTILAPKQNCTFMEIGNQMQNHKTETNSELIIIPVENQDDLELGFKVFFLC